MKADLVAAMLTVRPDGRVLVLQRPEGTWDPPGGRLARGETFEAGAVRELFEETGLLAAPERPVASWVGGSPVGRLAAVTFIGRVAGGEVRLSDEHLGFKWVTPGEWVDLHSWWSRENRLRVDRHVRALLAPDDGLPEPPETPKPRLGAPPVEANLGAGSVLVDFGGDEPRALLLRRRKPPVGLWENPGGMLEEGEDFLGCARRETLEETGLDAEPEAVWWCRVEPWRGPGDRELYAGVGFVSRYAGGEVLLEEAAHDEALWATEREWRSLKTWYTPGESDVLWRRISELRTESEA
ncbi:NUDIX domain [Rubrobacter radiotolerans]|uniref:NUDIX domain n=1 Tax=Rubrobacter radiotolerans TaxID=42256 RepID=A0A023X674_RUBRA|nr:NUDIX hydrolase [Rubrobacter radiotolerans]AHY47711.1 NUDIX domain [Rubrobacter radiotolerans]MDX5895114.1 NUDIX hydrolase [Rubrobacter radiotolerans]SMC07482.1 NUDIX domain-containing protein [Rubrobacter radiotolerans DSM 5868]